MDVNYSSESILFQLQIGSKICNFISLYRAHSQTADNFDSFLDNLKLNLDAMTDDLHEIPFSMKSRLLADPLLIKMISKLFKRSFMETQLILSMITN